MFWSGNYIAVRELNFLLKAENVSLTQVLEADDILQECKADNKALIQFLTKPEVLAELITLITEEPPKNVELASQYRHASIACEVLTSHLSTIADRLSLDTVQMNRLCDFINREPPLNPLLASYFSKTVEMLLERSPKQDWYLYHIVCLRVLDFFRSRRDFMPNLLRHVATSAIADTFKFILRLDDLFNKIVMEWLDEHQFLDALIQIICGSYVPEPLRPHTPAPAPPPRTPPPPPDQGKGEAENDAQLNHKEDSGDSKEKPLENNTSEPSKEEEQKTSTDLASDSKPESNETSEKVAPVAESNSSASTGEERWRAVAAANAAGLLCDLILNGCAGEGCTTRQRTVWTLVARLQSEAWVRALLGAVFTSPAPARAAALVHSCHVLRALLSSHPILAGQSVAERTSVELAVAPHLPLLHQALLQPPPPPPHAPLTSNTTNTTADNEHKESGGGGRQLAGASGAVGAARVHVAALLAQLAISEVEDVPTTMITLGTPGTLLELFFRHPDNNFLHAHVYELVKHALNNRAYRTQYAHHILIECNLLTRLMDVFEENENKSAGAARAGYMGHVVLALRRVSRALDEQDGELAQQLHLPAELSARWAAFTRDKLAPLLHQHDTPLGGYYPSENIYEVDNMPELGDNVEASYEFNDVGGNGLDDLAEEINIDAGADFGTEPTEGGDAGCSQLTEEMVSNAKSIFLERAMERFGDDMWDDSPEHSPDEEERGGGGGGGGGAGVPPPHSVQDVLAAIASWDPNSGEGSASADEDWAQFGAAPVPPPVDPFAPILGGSSAPLQDFAPFWPSSDDTSDIPDEIMALSKFSISATFPDQMHEQNLPKNDNQPTNSPNVSENTNKLDVDNDNTIKSDSSDNPAKCETTGHVADHGTDS